MVAADIFGAFQQAGFAEGSEVGHVGERWVPAMGRRTAQPIPRHGAAGTNQGGTWSVDLSYPSKRNLLSEHSRALLFTSIGFIADLLPLCLDQIGFLDQKVSEPLS